MAAGFGIGTRRGTLEDRSPRFHFIFFGWVGSSGPPWDTAPAVSYNVKASEGKTDELRQS
jgi:uncharacterized protein YfiM (DUF2279 family)